MRCKAGSIARDPVCEKIAPSIIRIWEARPLISASHTHRIVRVGLERHRPSSWPRCEETVKPNAATYVVKDLLWAKQFQHRLLNGFLIVSLPQRYAPAGVEPQKQTFAWPPPQHSN